MTEEPALRVGVVDDHPIASEALVTRFVNAGFFVLPPAPAVESLDLTAVPDVVVCDLHLPGLSVGKAVAYLAQRGCRVLATTGVAMPDEVLDAVAAGACGFLEKTAPSRAFVKAVTEISTNGFHVSARLAGFLLEDAQRRPLSNREIKSVDKAILRAYAQGDTSDDLLAELNLAIAQLVECLQRIFDAARRRRRLHMPSPREAEVMVLVGCKGFSHKHAALRMGVKVSVIPDFLKSIKAKYLITHADADESVAPATAALLWARELGIC